MKKPLVYYLYIAASVAYLAYVFGEQLVEHIADRIAARLDWRFRNLVDHFAAVHAHLDHLESDGEDDPAPAPTKG